MKNIVIFVFVFIIKYVAGQGINYTPPSPEAFKFTNNTLITDDEYNGKLRISLPLSNFKSNKLNHAISLDYNQAGVKVDELATDIGMSWILNVGGIITRTVNDEADEIALQRLNKTVDQIYAVTVSDCDTDQFITDACYSNNVDTEADIFNFNFSGISGSFIFDANFNPIFLKNDNNVKIKTVNYNNSTNNKNFIGFEISTEDGIRYIFGGNGYTEQTSTATIPSSPHSPYYITSFFLKEIIYYNNEKILFNYYNSPSCSAHISEVDESYFPVSGEIGEATIGPGVKKSKIVLNTVDKKRLKEISSSETNDKIVFNYETYNFSTSSQTQYLKSIDYLHGDNTNIAFKKYFFDYLFDNVNERFFLKNIQFLNKNNVEEKYFFEYDDPLNLPHRLSYAQDMFGFYNGRNNNPSLIPKFYNNLTTLNPAFEKITNQYFGDRRADFTFAKKGSLISIKYPTGGKSEFEYEPNTAKDYSKKTGDIRLFLNNNIDEPDIVEAEYLIEKLPKTQYIKFLLTIGSDNLQMNHQKATNFDVIDLQDNSVVYHSGGTLGYQGFNNSFIPDYEFKMDHNYKVVLRFSSSNYSVFYNTSVFAHLSFVYYDSFTNIDSFGVRLKSVKQSDTSQINYKRFYYTPIEFYKRPLDLNIPLLKIQPEYSLVQIGNLTYGISKSPNTSSIYNSLLGNKYEYVSCSLDGDDFEKGGYEKRFEVFTEEPNIRIKPTSGPGSIVTNYQNYFENYFFSETIHGITSMLGVVYNKVFFPSKSNRMQFSGKNIYLKIFQKKNNNLFKIKQTNYLYNSNVINENPNLVIYKIFDDSTQAFCSGNFVRRISIFYFGLYYNYSIFDKISEEKNIEYIEGIPVNQNISFQDYMSYDSSSDMSNQLITIKNYQYDIFNRLILEKITFPDKAKIEKNLQYSYNINNQYLIDKNLVGIPLQTTTTKTENGNPKTISNVETTYPSSQSEADSKTNGLPLPISTKSYDFLGVANTEVTYDKYDAKGNILQYTLKSGVPVAIIWGYNQTQPIAKIEGATYAQAEAYSADIVAKSNLDIDAASEQTFITALDTLRNNSNLSNYQITTYSYDPLIGVTSITPPSGIREIYKYDTANRLQSVIDVNGNILKEYQYNYKQ